VAGLKSAVVEVNERIALLSLHDVSPVFEDDVVASCDRFADLGISSFSLLVVPMYALKKANSFEKSPLFSEYLQSLGLEISMHGYSHFTKSGSMDEFRKMDSKRVTKRAKSGVAIIAASLGQKPYGFVPPLWQAPPRVGKAMKAAGMKYSVVENKIHSFLDGRIHRTVETLVSQGVKGTSFANALLEIELGGPVQVGVHPRDHAETQVFELIEDMKDRMDYSFIGYCDYLTHR
jgi:predicted deacetylase